MPPREDSDLCLGCCSGWGQGCSWALEGGRARIWILAQDFCMTLKRSFNLYKLPLSPLWNGISSLALQVAEGLRREENVRRLPAASERYHSSWMVVTAPPLSTCSLLLRIVLGIDRTDSCRSHRQHFIIKKPPEVPIFNFECIVTKTLFKRIFLGIVWLNGEFDTKLIFCFLGTTSWT